MTSEPERRPFVVKLLDSNNHYLAMEHFRTEADAIAHAEDKFGEVGGEAATALVYRPDGSVAWRETKNAEPPRGASGIK